MPPCSMRPPASMKKGIAMKGKESAEVNILCATTAGFSGRLPNVIPAMEASPMLTATGMFRKIRTMRTENMMVAIYFTSEGVAARISRTVSRYAWNARSATRNIPSGTAA